MLLDVLVAAMLVATLIGARGADAAAVKEMLFQAKKAYDAETRKFRDEVGDLLDKREEVARKGGNKALVDQIKRDRNRFDKEGEVPHECPKALLATVAAARANLDKAYAAAVKDLVRLKEDDAAEAVEKEQQKFQLEAAILFGKRTSLATLKALNVKVWNNSFDQNATFKVDGVNVRQSVFLHPDEKGEGLASFTLAGKATVFRATVGLPTHFDGQGDPSSPVTFEILGDGKSLWKSEPFAKIDTFQKCSVPVGKVKTLTLRTTCKDFRGAHAVWLAPVIVE